MIPEITVFGLVISTYSLMAVIAAITCAALSWRPLLKSGFSQKGTAALLLVMCIAFLIGARLWNYAVNPKAYGDADHWYSLQMAGFSMYGGILGSLIVIVAAALITRIRLVKVLDAITIPGAVAFCIARIGCFLNGCCSGKNTDLPWGVIFPSEMDELIKDVIPIVPIQRSAVHPTQLYELILALIGIPLCLWLVKLFRAGDGGRFFIYGVWFNTMRLAVLPLRALPYSRIVTSVVYPLLYYVLIVIGIFLFVWSCRKSRTEREKVIAE